MWCRLAVVILFFKLKFFHIVFNEGLGRGNQLYYEKLPSVCLKYENNTSNTLYAHLSWIVSYKVHCSSIHVVLYFAFCGVQFIFLNIEIDCIWEVVSIGFIFDHINNSSHSIMTPKYMDYVSCLFNNLSILTHCSYTYSNYFAQPEITLCPSYVRNKSRLLKLNC